MMAIDPAARAAPVRLFSADLDGTLLGDPEASRRFKSAWMALPSARRPLLVYNSGRLVDDILGQVANRTLVPADYYLGGVGTQVLDGRTRCRLHEIEAQFLDGWDLARVREIAARVPSVRPQPEAVQTAFKSSWHLEDAAPGVLDALQWDLADAGLKVRVVYSSGRDLDVLPRCATKGGALAWLCLRLGLPLEHVLVAGDTANDTSMFFLPGVRGILVGNTLPELVEATRGLPVFRAGPMLADGVLEGLAHFGVLAAAPETNPFPDRARLARVHTTHP